MLWRSCGGCGSRATVGEVGGMDIRVNRPLDSPLVSREEIIRLGLFWATTLVLVVAASFALVTLADALRWTCPGCGIEA